MPEMIREAMYYKDLGNHILQCELCPHYCVIAPGELGKCRSRENIDAKLWIVNYGKALGISVDPIEKKPLYHYRPGSHILSLGPNSCNLNCRWCQNYQISQFEADTIQLSLEELYGLVLKYNPSTLQIAFTYSEPLTWYEYILDFAVKYPEINIVLVTNGFINPEPLAELLPHISAVNIDLKGIDEDLYRNYCSGSLAPVKESIRQCAEASVHLEVTLLLIPGVNDSKEDIEQLVNFVASISDEIPLHISAYHPDYLMNNRATTYEDIKYASEIAHCKLKYVYGGNLPIEDMRDTYCPSCHDLLCKRSFSETVSYITADSECSHCGRKIYGKYDS